MYLDRERALRPAEAAEGGVALRVRLRQSSRGSPPRAASRHCRSGTARASSPGRQVGRDGRRARPSSTSAPRMRPVVVEADLVVEVEAVAAAGDQEVVVAVQAQLDRALQPLRGDRGDAGEQRRLRLLAAEAAAHAPALDLHLVRRQLQRVRHEVLHLAGVLGRAVHLHAAVFLRHRVRDLAFEVELLLAADAKRPCRRCGAAAIAAGAPASTALQVHRRHHVLLLRRGPRAPSARAAAARSSRTSFARAAARRAASRVVATTAKTGWPERSCTGPVGRGSGRRARSARSRSGRGCRAAVKHRHHTGQGAQQVERRCREAAVRQRRQAQRGSAACRRARAGRRCRARAPATCRCADSCGERGADLRRRRSAAVGQVDGFVHGGLRVHAPSTSTRVSCAASGACGPRFQPAAAAAGLRAACAGNRHWRASRSAA